MGHTVNYKSTNALPSLELLQLLPRCCRLTIRPSIFSGGLMHAAEGKQFRLENTPNKRTNFESIKKNLQVMS